MASLFIAVNQIQDGAPYGHLQYVYGSIGGSLLEAEVKPPTGVILGSWSERFNQNHATNTPNYGESTDYYIREVVLKANQSASYVWELIGQIASSLSATSINYDLFTQNSNSFIKTVSYIIGQTSDFSQTMLHGDITSIPGFYTNVLFGAKVGSSTISGVALSVSGTAGNDYVAAGNGNDSLGGSGGNDTILGDNGSDRLYGGSGNDTLLGGAGSDTFVGGSGIDRLDLGSDSNVDVIVFLVTSDSASSSNRDQISRFGSGIDDIDVRAIDANLSTSGNAAFKYTGMTAAANSIWYAKSGSDLIVYGDVNGDRTADFQFQLTGVGSVSGSDFLL